MKIKLPLSFSAPDVDDDPSIAPLISLDSPVIRARPNQVQSRNWVDCVTPVWVIGIMLRSVEQAEAAQGV